MSSILDDEDDCFSAYTTQKRESVKGTSMKIHEAVYSIMLEVIPKLQCPARRQLQGMRKSTERDFQVIF